MPRKAYNWELPPIRNMKGAYSNNDMNGVQLVLANWMCGEFWNHYYAIVTQYNKRYILSTFEKMGIFALSNRGLNQLSNDIKFVKLKWYFWKYNFYKVYISFYFLYILHTILFIISEWRWPTRCPFCCIGSQFMEQFWGSCCPIINSVIHY